MQRPILEAIALKALFNTKKAILNASVPLCCRQFWHMMSHIPTKKGKLLRLMLNLLLFSVYPFFLTMYFSPCVICDICLYLCVRCYFIFSQWCLSILVSFYFSLQRFLPNPVCVWTLDGQQITIFCS